MAVSDSCIPVEFSLPCLCILLNPFVLILPYLLRFEGCVRGLSLLLKEMKECIAMRLMSTMIYRYFQAVTTAK